MTEGIYTFRSAVVEQVQLAQMTLSIMYRPTPSQPPRLVFYQGPEGNFLREIFLPPTVKSPADVELSPDGGKVALRRDERRLEVHGTAGSERFFITRSGGFGPSCRLWVADDCFVLNCGRRGNSWYLVEWSHGVLVCQFERKQEGPAFRKSSLEVFFRDMKPMEALQGEFPLLEDTQRLSKGARKRALFALDRFGQVYVFDARARLVFQFFAHGDSWSAWMPDGTRYGVGMVHTWPRSPEALKKMGRALEEATRIGKQVIP